MKRSENTEETQDLSVCVCVCECRLTWDGWFPKWGADQSGGHDAITWGVHSKATVSWPEILFLLFNYGRVWNRVQRRVKYIVLMWRLNISPLGLGGSIEGVWKTTNEVTANKQNCCFFKKKKWLWLKSQEKECILTMKSLHKVCVFCETKENIF